MAETGGLWDTLQSACCHSKWAQSRRLGTRSLSSLSEGLVKIPALYLQLFQFHVLRRAGRTLPLINQWDRLHTF